MFNSAGQRRATARTFDVNNRIVSEQTGLIQPVGPIGPDNPWVSGPDTETHRITYDANGQKQTSTDPLGRVTTYGYDNRNRLETTTEPKRENQQAYPVTRLEYDRAGNKTKVTFPDQKTQQWLYHDAFGQPRQFIDERANPTDLNYWPWGPMKKLGSYHARWRGRKSTHAVLLRPDGAPANHAFPRYKQRSQHLRVWTAQDLEDAEEPDQDDQLRRARARNLQ